MAAVGRRAPDLNIRGLRRRMFLNGAAAGEDFLKRFKSRLVIRLHSPADYFIFHFIVEKSSVRLLQITI
jgi:hypothetical protein